MAQHLLCEACEDLLNKNGERWVLSNNYRLDGPSPLYRGAPLCESRSEVRQRNCNSSLAVPFIDIEKLIYFGTSLFWRASAADWNIGAEKVPLLDLE